MTEEDKLFRRHFFAFLKERDAYDKWLYNLLERLPMNGTEQCNVSLEKLFKQKCLCAINEAFIWDNTKEGYDFWSELNHKWCDLRLSLIY